MNILVIPTNRPERIDPMLAQWEPHADWDKVIIVEDGPECTPLRSSVEHYCWADIDKLGAHACIISRRDSAIRSFGFLKARHLGASLVVTLDDDCLPHALEGGFCAAHLCRMETAPIWESTIPRVRLRGLPYHNMGQRRDVMVNIGLWHGRLDYDAATRLVHGDRIETPAIVDRVIPGGSYVPMCGMNLAFRAEAVPLMYFPLMGQGQPYHRFDDIWAVIIAKKISDHLGWAWTVGHPLVWHDCQSDVFCNLADEVAGLVANESFWEMIDNIQLDSQKATECVCAIGEALLQVADDNAYCVTLGNALLTWAHLTA